MNINYVDAFAALRPGFFEEEHIRALPEDETYVEQVIDLHSWQEGEPVPCPAHITFGWYTGDMAKLQSAVREVEEDWAQWFGKGDRVFCAFDGEKIASFCLLDSFGEYAGLRVGAPGCVGTVPAYRKQGIGLRMVQKATAVLQQEGYDLSWIHYTAVGPWYAKLGYRTVLEWNGRGILA